MLDDGELLTQQAASMDGPGLVSILLEGAPNAGKVTMVIMVHGMMMIIQCSADCPGGPAGQSI